MKKMIVFGAVLLLLSCSADYKQVKWKVVITSESEMYSMSMYAEQRGQGGYQYSDNTPSTVFEHEFVASKRQGMEININSYTTKGINVKLYEKDELVRDETFTVNPDLAVDMIHFEYENF